MCIGGHDAQRVYGLWVGASSSGMSASTTGAQLPESVGSRDLRASVRPVDRTLAVDVAVLGACANELRLRSSRVIPRGWGGAIASAAGAVGICGGGCGSWV